MTKILLYTISDLKTHSINCIDLLLSSIIKDINFDFLILTNKNINTSKYAVAYDIAGSSHHQYIGYLKYLTYLIPNDYDYYIYLDSDILYFDNISKLLPKNKLFSVVKESGSKVKDSEWYYFKHTPKEDDFKLREMVALNAGTFVFHNSQKDNIHKMYELYSKYSNGDMHHDVRLEQAIYNYIVYRSTDYNEENLYDLTNMTQLFASNYSPQENKKLYHFCGFTNEMTTKYNSMKNFYEKYKQQK